MSIASGIHNQPLDKQASLTALPPTAYCHENHVKKKGEDSLRPFEL
jgi:hypothetical protein